MTVWLAVVGTSVGCYLLKLAGLSLPRRLLVRSAVQRVAGLLPVALLAALVAVQTVATGRHLQADARLPALAVALVLVVVRAPFLAVVAAAAGTAAGLRLL